VTDAAKLRFITEHYARLQGLRLIPLGILFLCLAAWRGGLLPALPTYDSDVAARWFVGGLVGAVGAAYATGAWYARRFGTVEPHRFRTGGPSLLANAAIVGSLMVLHDFLRPPVSLPMLYVGVVCAYTGVVQGGVRKHYLLIAAACVVFAFIQRFHVDHETGRTLLNLLVGSGLVVAGIGDHLLLRRTLRPPSRQAYVDTTV
jgi:hypothetical protein